MFRWSTFIKDNFKKEGMSGRNYITKCIFCRDSTHLWLHLDKEFYHCFKCDEGGNKIAFLMAYYNQSYKEIIEFLKSNVKVDLNDLATQLIKLYDDQVDEEVKEDLFIRVSLPSKTVSLNSASNKCKNWIVGKRNFSISYLKKFGLTFCVKGKYYNRVIIPIETLNHRTFQAYDVMDKKYKRKKQMNPPGIQKSSFLYMYNESQMHDIIVITEGVFDAIRLWSYNYPTVALLGKKISPMQRQLLINSQAKEVVFCLDGDALKETRAQAEKFSSMFTGVVSVIELPKDKDPDDILDEEVFDGLFLKREHYGSLSKLQNKINELKE